MCVEPFRRVLYTETGTGLFRPPPESGRERPLLFPQENLKPKQSKYRSTRKEFAEWFAAPFDGETKQRLMREYWDALSPEMSQDRVQKAYARVRERIGFRSVSLPSPQGVRPVFRRAAVMVAMIAIPVLAVALYALIGHMNSAPKWQEIYAPYGQTRSVVLADGSQIVINSGSRLIYPDRFAGKERRVFLC